MFGKSGIDYLRNLGKYKWNFHKYVKINITKNAVIQRKSQIKKVTGVYTMEDAKIQLTCNFQYCKAKIHRTIIVLERIKTPIPEDQQTISASRN